MDKTQGAKRSGLSNSQGPAGKQSKDRSTAANKSVGLNEDLKLEIEKFPDLAPLLRLHDLNKRVKGKNHENQDKIDKLQLAFKHLGEKIKDVFKDQNVKVTVTPAAVDKKKDDKKGGK